MNSTRGLVASPFPCKFDFMKCCSSADDKTVVKASGHIPRIINWVTKKDHPRLDYLMRIIFKEVNNSIECFDHNKVIDSDNYFQHPPVITSIKGKEKVVERSYPVKKKKKQYVLVSPKKSSPKAIKLPPRRQMPRQATRSQSANINTVEKHSDAGTSHTNKHVERKSVQDTTEMAQSKKSSGTTISRDEFEAFENR
ncbi:hypothetical protein RDI58_017942 [Solanum bulbocastanum]|uniref:Uncharacterized protein n=1 Tax=Solanum bulbocastanum TaxID=147425 RepID=A0AAN8TFZ2_SOLBU